MLDRCLYIFKHSEFLSEQPFEIEDGLVEKFLYACEVANFNEKKRITYFEDKMSEIDYRYEMDSERAEGRAKVVPRVVPRWRKPCSRREWTLRLLPSAQS